jgi:excinuclease ABC subunit B
VVVPPFRLDATYAPTADQPKAIDQICEAMTGGERYTTLLGATGTGKTMTMAATVERLQRPTLVLAHNKTLAAQLCNEFRTYFPDNAVEYFVSYYDYYQPEAYVPSRDLYIEKDSAINQEVDRLRHAATAGLFARRDILIVASVSAIFGLGSPETYDANVIILKPGETIDRDDLLMKLVSLQYTRNDVALGRGDFRVRGETLEIFPAYAETAYRATLFGDEVERLQHFDPLTGELIEDDLEHVAIWPASHYNVKEGRSSARSRRSAASSTSAAPSSRPRASCSSPTACASARSTTWRCCGRWASATASRTTRGSSTAAAPGSRPYCLIDYFPEGLRLLHRRVPPDRAADRRHVRGRPVAQDDARRLRLPAAQRDGQPAADVRRVHVDHAADPVRLGDARRLRAQPLADDRRADRPPTGHRRPAVEVRETRNQIDDLMNEVRKVVDRDERVLVTTLTKKMSEDLTDYLLEMGFKVRYLHSEIDTLERIQIIRDLRLGEYDVLVGVNLPARGPRPARGLPRGDPRRRQGGLPARRDLAHPDDRPRGAQRRRPGGHVRRQGDRGDEGRARRDRPAPRDPDRLQRAARHHAAVDRQGDLGHHRVPHVGVQGPEEGRSRATRGREEITSVSQMEKVIVELEEEMVAAADELKFEYAARLRDEIRDLRRELRDMQEAPA